MLQELNVLSFLNPHVAFYVNAKNQTLLQNVETDFQHYSFGEELLDGAQHLTPPQRSRNTHNPHLTLLSKWLDWEIVSS